MLAAAVAAVFCMQDLTPRAKDSLVSFGERLATRIFASYLRTQVGGWGQPCTSH
jgi:aspartate kinase